MKLQKLTARPALIIFAVALAGRLAWVLMLPERLAWPDEQEFVEIARRLAAGHGFIATSYRSNPVLPAYLGAVFSIFGESYLAARIGQALLGALTCVLVYHTAALSLGSAAGVLSGLLLAIYLPHIYLSGVFYVECVFTFFVSLSVYLAVRTLYSERPLATALLCGISCGITVLTRSVFAVYLPALCAAWAYAAWPQWRRSILACTALAIGSVAVVLPWTARNYATFGRLVPVSSGFYTTLWQGNNRLTEGNADDRFLFWDTPYWAPRLQHLPAPEQRAVRARYTRVAAEAEELQQHGTDRYLATDALLKPIVFDYIATHPGRTAELFAHKLITLFSAFTSTDTANQFTSRRYKMITAVLFYPMLLLGIAGAVLGRRARALAVIYALIGSLSVVYALLTTCTRYRLPIDPYLIVLASFAIVELHRHGLAALAPRHRFGPAPRAAFGLRDVSGEVGAGAGERR